MERNKTNTKEIFKHLRVVDAFRNIDQDMPIGQVAFFLHASREEGSSLRDVAQMANCKMATASGVHKERNTYTLICICF